MVGKIVMGRTPETRTKVEGYGVKFMGDRTFVITNDGEKEIIPSSVRIILDEPETVVTEVITQEQLNEMHNLLVQTVIDYLRTKATNSGLYLYGYEDGKNKLVGFSM